MVDRAGDAQRHLPPEQGLSGCVGEGLAQARCSWKLGLVNIDFDRWMELDLEYIDGWSLWNDVQICLKTIPAVLDARGAQ
jgi:lipopolysaccharide/colanic/teichoic acid biosynthesis glycosyltransferase